MNIVTYLPHPIVAPWHFQQRHAELLGALLPEARVIRTETVQELQAHLPEADVALAWIFKQEWLSLAPRLRVLSTPAAGKDYFHITPPPELILLNGHFHGEIIAETVVGMILGIIRGILPNATTYQQLPWARQELTPGMMTLRNSTVTILGFGHIGQWIGKLLKPFGTHIQGMARHHHPAPDWFDEQDAIFLPDQLEQRLPHTDHLILALPSTTGTDHMLNRQRLELLPPHATVINVGRGNAIDEDALMERLRTHRLLGAVLDVFQREPLQADDPLRSCPNLWTLPHASAIAENYLDLYVREVAQDLKRLLVMGNRHI